MGRCPKKVLAIVVYAVLGAVAYLILDARSTFTGAYSHGPILSASVESESNTARVWSDSTAERSDYSLETPEQAASNLQDTSWVERLRIRETHSSRRRGGRIVEWSVEPAFGSGCADMNSTEGIDVFLKPFPRRSAQLIDLFLHGQVSTAMGENVVMLGYAKAALALGCRRVVMFEANDDFVDYLDKTKKQVYIVDFMSLPPLKNALLSDETMAQRTWELAYWGRRRETIHHPKGLNLPEQYTFTSDHALVPFNYSNLPAENVRVGVLPTAITMNHVRREKGASAHYNCDVFFMGKASDQVKMLKPLIKLIEEKVLAMSAEKNASSVNICTGMKLPENTTLDEYFGFPAQHTVNLGRTDPEVFADIVGSARVVVGSGKPPASPTIVDTIFGGGVFMAPTKQFNKKSLTMEDHPLFIKADELTLEDQADEIIRIVLDGKEKQPFGGYDVSSYSVMHVCRQVLRFIEASFNSSWTNRPRVLRGYRRFCESSRRHLR